MRKLVVSTFMTLDGVMQAPGGPEEDPTGGFTLGGWSVPYWEDSMSQVMARLMGKPFELLLGRKTYEIFAAYWPFSDEPGAAELNAARKYVATTTLESADWNNTSVLRGDVVPQIAALKEQDGPEIQVHGSSNLIQTLLRNDLVDEFWVMIFPVVVGSGKRLFGDGTVPASFTVRDASTSSTGVLMSTYERAGDISVGSFESAEPTEQELKRRQRLRAEQ
ncbi:MAG: dihydrofolate reductase family protein [Jiangellaceae bacterium]|nr:dihydrofolate reductase family protein [Jiangellaceae bacterium]